MREAFERSALVSQYGIGTGNRVGSIKLQVGHALAYVNGAWIHYVSETGV